MLDPGYRDGKSTVQEYDVDERTHSYQVLFVIASGAAWFIHTDDYWPLTHYLLGTDEDVLGQEDFLKEKSGNCEAVTPFR